MLRRIRRDLPLLATTTATLAVCIGANTTVFSIVDSVLLRPIPFSDPSRIYWFGTEPEAVFTAWTFR